MIEDRPGLFVKGLVCPKEVGHGSLGGIYEGIQRLWCVLSSSTGTPLQQRGQKNYAIL